MKPLFGMLKIIAGFSHKSLLTLTKDILFWFTFVKSKDNAVSSPGIPGGASQILCILLLNCMGCMVGSNQIC